MKNAFSFFRTRCRWLCAVILALVIGFMFAACDSPVTSQPETDKPSVSLPSGTLPSIRLSIAANVNPWYGDPGRPNELHRTNWRSTTVSLSGGDDSYAGFAFGPVNATARGRGNSSWWMHEKRPLRFRFATPQPMFGSSYAATDWSLISNAMDYTLMRNYAAYLLGSLLSGLDFSPAHHMVHLYLNNEYRGVYMLTDQIHRHNGRIELINPIPSAPERSEFLLEWCGRVPEENVGSSQYAYFTIHMGEGEWARDVPFGISFPGSGVLRGNHGFRNFAADFVGQVNDALVRRDFNEISRLIDLDSFIDFYLVQELFQNMDVGFSSVFFQIRQINGSPRLFAGPLWDFDLSSGSAIGHYSDSQPPRSGDCLPIHYPTARWSNPWFGHLMATPQFRNMVVQRWNTIRNREVRTMTMIIRRMAIRYRACFDRNFERWDQKLGNYTWRNSIEVVNIPASRGHMGQVDFFLDWLDQRKVLLTNVLLPREW